MQAVYGTEEQTIQTRVESLVWRIGPGSSDGPASDAMVAAARASGAGLNSATVGMCFHEHYQPAQFEKEVLVKEASTRLEQVDATYNWAEEQVIDKPTHTVWKKGTGPIQKIDAATGEILCLVDVPATHKTIRKRVLTSAAGSQTVEIPAEYKTVSVTKLVSAAKEMRTFIEAEYQSVTRQELDAEGYMEWRAILCETNMTGTRRSAIQVALRDASRDPGRIDGVIGSETVSAVNAFQRAKGLPVDRYLNIQTLDALGVSAN
ncbi:MAG: peptidoglycan-binding protein [Chromatiales bacterium]|nr:peptidoglycan-binding protein [Chromatiales bacterium]